MRRTIAALTLVGVSLLAVGSASATFPGANGRIAYVGSGGIHTVLASGQDDGLIAYGDTPSWSANGRRIAFSRTVNFDPETGGNNEIFTMSHIGSDLRRLTHTRRNAYDANPSYSPSGRRIVFTRDDVFGPGVWVMTIRSDGTDRRTLAREAGNAVWSPDGKWIAYGKASKHGVWVMHPNGTDKHRILKRGAVGDYSPDGRHITLVRCGEDDRCRYFIARSDGSKVRRLPCPPDFFRGLTVPSYSPNGRRLLGEVGPSGPGPVRVVKLPLHSCSPKVVVSSGTSALPAWQPVSMP